MRSLSPRGQRCPGSVAHQPMPSAAPTAHPCHMCFCTAVCWDRCRGPASSLGLMGQQMGWPCAALWLQPQPSDRAVLGNLTLCHEWRACSSCISFTNRASLSINLSGVKLATVFPSRLLILLHFIRNASITRRAGSTGCPWALKEPLQ